MHELMEKFNRFGRSEQIALLVLGLFLALLLLWVLLINPLERQRDQLNTTIKANSSALVQVQGMVKTIMAQGPSVNPSGDPINTLVDNSLRHVGLTMSNLQPGTNGDVRVRLDKANYAALMQWLQDLEYVHGVIIKELSIVASDESGFVNANVRLQK